jgi:hypothetical protein
LFGLPRQGLYLPFGGNTSFWFASVHTFPAYSGTHDSPLRSPLPSETLGERMCAEIRSSLKGMQWPQHVMLMTGQVSDKNTVTRSVIWVHHVRQPNQAYTPRNLDVATPEDPSYIPRFYFRETPSRASLPSTQRDGGSADAGRVFHSSRKATRGSTRVARCAGM